MTQEYKTSLISEVVTGKVDVWNIRVEEIIKLETIDETEVKEEVSENNEP